MKGQWIGSYDGSTAGDITINVDELEEFFQGVAYLHANDSTLPSTATFFSTPNKNSPVQFRADLIHAIDPTSGDALPWDKVKAHYPSIVSFSKYADVTASWNDGSLRLDWITNTGLRGNSALPKSNAEMPSELQALNKDWGAFKEHVATLAPRKFLFRGQNEPLRLRTRFHHTGRTDLSRFIREDIPALHKHLSARTKHIFNLQDPDENGAFCNLVQHYGYPTPLLDWTYSPYVAAFFAYRGISNEQAAKAGASKTVRIHIFDQQQWKTDLQTIFLLVSPTLHVSIAEFMPIENDRMIPQQSASTVTNIDDIETYIRSRETDAKKYLYAVDLPMSDRKKVVRELSYMEITAGSLFPGLDGACEELRERHFEL
jgi:hypothetical protein